MSNIKLQKTSLEAYRSLDPKKISDIHKRILDALKVIGKGHYEDIAKAAHADPSRIWKRLSECHKSGLIERTGERKALSSGRDGFVWTLADKYVPLVKITESVIPGKTISEYSKAIHQIQLF